MDGSRVILWGTSFSGGHVIAAAAADGRVSAVISQCPFTDGLASARTNSLRATGGLAARALRDVVGSWFGRAPPVVTCAGRPGEVALMTAPDVWDGYRALLPPGGAGPNHVAARIALRIGLYRPGRKAAAIKAPILFCICDHDSVAPAKAALAHARKAPRGDIRRYDCGHFDIYAGADFERVVTDQLDFLRTHVPTA